MSRGKRTEEGASPMSALASLFRRVGRFCAEHKRVVLAAGVSVVTLAIVLVVVLALNDGEPADVVVTPSGTHADGTDAPAPEPSEPEPEVVVFEHINPLTGLYFTNDESVGLRRPISVMHNNSYNPGGRHHALPMFGIGQADIIYEVLAEGATTRMLALYQDLSKLPKIGAVRSTRTYYLELSLAYDAVLVHVGQSPQAQREMREWGMEHIDGITQPASNFWRDYTGRAGVGSEHAMFTSGEVLMGLFGQKTRHEVDNTFDNGLHFGATETVPSGEMAGKVAVPFARNGKRTTFDFDSDDGLYYVGQYNAPFVDGEDNKQVAVTNVLVLQTSVGLIPGDKEGRLRVDLQSGGSGYYICSGQYVPITWERGGLREPFRYFTTDGEPLQMNPGKTYACVIGNNLEPTFE